jgi:hypothetical protein
VTVPMVSHAVFSYGGITTNFAHRFDGEIHNPWLITMTA